MTAVYLAERPVRSFPQIERPGPTLYAAERPRVSLFGFEAPQEHIYFAERPSSSLAFGTLPPYLPDVAGLFDFDIQLSAVHSEIHIWGAAMPISIQLSATAYPIEYATAEFTTSVELEVGKLAEYPFAIELSATVKMVADAAYQQAINLAATAYPVEIQTGPLTLATALSASAYPVELQTAVDNVALQLSATGYPIEISSASASLATALTAAGYPVELGGTVSQAIAVEFTATAYESVWSDMGVYRTTEALVNQTAPTNPYANWLADPAYPDTVFSAGKVTVNGSGLASLNFSLTYRYQWNGWMYAVAFVNGVQRGMPVAWSNATAYIDQTRIASIPIDVVSGETVELRVYTANSLAHTIRASSTWAVKMAVVIGRAQLGTEYLIPSSAINAITGMVADSGTTLVSNGVQTATAKPNATVEASVRWQNKVSGSTSQTFHILKNGTSIATLNSSASGIGTTALVSSALSLPLAANDYLALGVSGYSGVTRAVVVAGSETWIRVTTA